MRIQKLSALIILGLSYAAAADFRTVMEVHEVDLVYLRLPVTESGTLAFSDCQDCPTQTLRASATTHYVVNGQTVTLRNFRKAISSITNRDDVIVDVFHDLATDAAIRVRVKL